MAARQLCALGGTEPEGGYGSPAHRCRAPAHSHCARQNLFGFLQFLALPAHLLWQTLERGHGLWAEIAGRSGEEAVEVREKFIFLWDRQQCYY